MDSSHFPVSREYAVRNPMNGHVMTVPGDTQANAQKMAALVPGSLVMTRTVTEWVVDDPEKGWPGFCQNCRNPLIPPDATACNVCGEDDIDD